MSLLAPSVCAGDVCCCIDVLKLGFAVDLGATPPPTATPPCVQALRPK
jgi:hypothetical protein